MDVKELIDSLAEFDEMEDETGLNTVKAEKKDIKESLNEKNEYPIEGYEDWTTEDFLNQYDLDTVVKMFINECGRDADDEHEYSYETALEGLLQQMSVEDIPAKEALKDWLYEYFDKYELIELQTKVDEV